MGAGIALMDLLADAASYLTDPANYQGRFGLHRLLLQHLHFSIVSVVIAVVIALPLGLLVGHRRRGDLLVVNLTNVGRAVPDFGIILIALLILGLGAAPVVVALTALAIPPIVINTYVGVRQVDPDARDAAFGMGMSGWQVLTGVEIPSAVPLIMTGIRTAAVQVVATATLAGAVGGGGLGRPIYDALRVGFEQGRTRMFVAATAVALLALLTEAGLAALQRFFTPQGLRTARPNAGSTTASA